MSVAQKDGIEQRSHASQITYEDLYRRWEEGNWKATDIDFSADREGWNGLSDIQRRSAMWIFSMFFYGEDRVADDLSPYIDAAPTEEQKYFLATQQVDEARHAVFFHRFFKEVIGTGDTLSETIASTLPELNWGYRGVFDRLDRMAVELRRDRSLPKFAQAIALYHMVVEATLAQPGQHFIEDHVAKTEIMPGFASGMHNVSRDEQRHIGFGVKTLSELFEQSDECRAAVVEILREVLPYSLGVFRPPGWDERYTREWGFELEDIYAFAVRSVRAKWRAAGYPLEEMPPDVFPVDPELPETEIAARQLKLMKAGVMGDPDAERESDPEVQRLYFDLVSRSVDTGAANGRPMTIQWRFSDADPWHVVVNNGSTRAEPGEAPVADVTLETSWADWIGISLYGAAPWRALLTRRVRLHGRPSQLMRMSRIFPRRPAAA